MWESSNESNTSQEWKEYHTLTCSPDCWCKRKIDPDEIVTGYKISGKKIDFENLCVDYKLPNKKGYKK